MTLATIFGKSFLAETTDGEKEEKSISAPSAPRWEKGKSHFPGPFGSKEKGGKRGCVDEKSRV